LTVRLTAKSVTQLKRLASRHNLSQADVIECLLEAEFQATFPSSKKQNKERTLDHCEEAQQLKAASRKEAPCEI
jgi:Mg/Co/Ni transporter MgtE